MANLLEVTGLKTEFHTQDGVVHAVNGVSFHLGEGETLGIVGESGCGKSVSMLSIMRLIPIPPGLIAEGEVMFDGRDLLKLGIIPMDNMLPETAYMKLAWVLGQTEDPARIREMLLTPVNHEVTSREPHNGYLVLQGGLPEVDAFVGQHWK